MNLDTSPDIVSRRIAALSALTPEERFKEAIEMSNVVADLAAAGRAHRAERQASDRTERTAKQ